MAGAPILVGVIGRPHGVRGLVHVQSLTADPAALSTYAPLRDDDDQTYTLAWRMPGVAEIRTPAGPISDRSAAERLTNRRLYIDRAQLPPPAEDEFYLADLVGLEARDAAGATLGQVTQVHDYGAGASLEIAGQGRGLLIPFTQAAIPTIDPAAGYLTVIPPTELDAP